MDGNASNPKVEGKNSAGVRVIGKPCGIEPLAKTRDKGGAHVPARETKHSRRRNRNVYSRQQCAIGSEAVKAAGRNAATPIAALLIASSPVRPPFGFAERA